MSTSRESVAGNTPSGAVALPPRKNRADAASNAPVWSLEASADGNAEVPLAAKCDLHNRERTVCCRDLKGDDERHLIDPDVVKDIIIGLADGLTVPFALTAGLSSLGSSKLVVTAGIAELVSGALSMGVGGYLSAQAERDHYRYLKKQTRERVMRSCAGEMEREVNAILSPLGVDDSLSRRVAGALLSVEATLPPPEAPLSITRQCLNAIARRPRFTNLSNSDPERARLLPTKTDSDTDDDDKGLTAFLLKFGEGLEETTDARLFISALTIGLSYFLGGLIPLAPYFFFHLAVQALWWSVGITGVVLLLFGAVKAYVSGAEIGVAGYAYGSISTLLVGGAAAAASFGIVRALEGRGE
ncbi:Protein CCC1 [Rhodotorula toruloides]|uniref:VIT family-domain containing protein n=1 Tax=Rhodotorula toruloides TaxID=5286 RepID=A0A2T0AHF0_RHOTO|nr:Protein CCC1 [Rhodotorula toruloides]PRQ77438.1 VIT family-domain containing protein [Rhodotorula toruloides]